MFPWRINGWTLHIRCGKTRVHSWSNVERPSVENTWVRKSGSHLVFKLVLLVFEHFDIGKLILVVFVLLKQYSVQHLVHVLLTSVYRTSKPTSRTDFQLNDIILDTSLHTLLRIKN